MRKFLMVLALLGVLIGSSACEAEGPSSSAATTSTSTTPLIKASTGSSSTASDCAAKFDKYADILGEAADIAEQITTRSEAVAYLELADAAVDTGRFLVETCGSYAPAGFASKVESIDDAADDLRRAL